MIPHRGVPVIAPRVEQGTGLTRGDLVVVSHIAFAHDGVEVGGARVRHLREGCAHLLLCRQPAGDGEGALEEGKSAVPDAAVAIVPNFRS